MMGVERVEPAKKFSKRALQRRFLSAEDVVLKYDADVQVTVPMHPFVFGAPCSASGSWFNSLLPGKVPARRCLPPEET